MSPKVKVCKACGQTKPITEFHGGVPARKSSKREWGFAKVEKSNRRIAARCIPCVVEAKLAKMDAPDHHLNSPENARWRNYYEEKAIQYSLADQRKHEQYMAILRAGERAEARERRQRYVEANPEKVKEYMRNYMKEYRAANKEAVKEAQRKYYQENKDRILEKRREAYAHKKGLDLL